LNIEDLLGKPLVELQRMSERDLELYFEPVLNITRPQLAMQQRVEKKLSSKLKTITPERAIALRMLANMGIDLDDL